MTLILGILLAAALGPILTATTVVLLLTLTALAVLGSLIALALWALPDPYQSHERTVQ